MIKRFCDVCDKQINQQIESEWRNGEMPFYRLIKMCPNNNTIDYLEIDICNECLQKVVALTRGEIADMGGKE